MQEERAYPGNFIRFLGTAGTRFIMLSQRRSSGGIWFSCGGARGVIDPGPGSLVRLCEAKPPISPISINTIILTHRHVDHSSDVNALAEGMTLKAAKPRGFVLLTRDCFEGGDSVLMNYMSKRIKMVAFHEDGADSEPAPDLSLESVAHSHNGVQCFGVIFKRTCAPHWGLISDTAPLESFSKRYVGCEMIVINVALSMPKARIDHMSLPEVESLLGTICPRTAVLTHMGNDLLDMGGERISRKLSTNRTKVIAATDGMVISLDGDFKNLEG
ncbi:MAG: hypothetical protein LBQ36_02345 [Synergistaceae bacterium]|nr:hypothetical protein [Synergistaceae bacterium]